MISSQRACVVVGILAVTYLGCIEAAPPSPPNSSSPPKRRVDVAVGGHCALGAAPVGPGGSWQIVEKDVEKVCAKGSSCRKGACNCDDLPDGTVMGISQDNQGNNSCRRIEGQKCSSDGECFHDSKCNKGVCSCNDPTKNDRACDDKKRDVVILS